MKLFTKECTALINTCDTYSDSWTGFFQLLDIQWPDFQLDIVLNTETKEFTFSDFNIRTIHFQGKEKMAWGERLIETLKRIDTKYILFFLDDFYLTDKVRVYEIEKCYNYMEENSNIVYFSFFPVEDTDNKISEKYIGFEKRPQRGKYRYNCQIALWNREKLISSLRRHESPWEMELYGSIRSRRCNDEFYTLSAKVSPIFCYQNGGVIMRGRWYLSRVVPLMEKYLLDIDLTERESYEDYLMVEHKRKRKLMRGIKNRIHIIKSIL